MKIIDSKETLEEIIKAWLIEDGEFDEDLDGDFDMEDYLRYDFGFNGSTLETKNILDSIGLFGFGNVAIEFEEGRVGTDTFYFTFSTMPEVDKHTWFPITYFDEVGFERKEDGRVWMRCWLD